MMLEKRDIKTASVVPHLRLRYLKSTIFPVMHFTATRFRDNVTVPTLR